MVGVRACGGNIPRYRLKRDLIYGFMGWTNPANIAHARGEKAVAGFDEDSITMAVAAARNAMSGQDRRSIDGVYFASTSMPYQERLNSGIISMALGVDHHCRAVDFSGALKAGTSALLSAIESVKAGNLSNVLVCSSDSRLGKPGSSQELIFGDSAAAFIISDQETLAEFKGSYSTTRDFVDHYRGSTAKFDRQWEERWIKDMGFDVFIPEAVNGLLDKYQLKIDDFAKVIYPCPNAGTRRKLNAMLGISAEAEQENFQAEIGESGTPHPLLMAVKAIEEAKPGDKILVISFGSGCDAIYFEVTQSRSAPVGYPEIADQLDNGIKLDNYSKYLLWRDILPSERGLRDEEDFWTRWSVNWRKQKEILGLWGSKCVKCGTAQYPPQRVCVNPECGEVDQMEDYCFSDQTGHILSFTADNLAVSTNPPALYGQVQFEKGGKYLFDFTDCELDSLEVGKPVRMSFRLKYVDNKRDISGYFWKAIPVESLGGISNG